MKIISVLFLVFCVVSSANAEAIYPIKGASTIPSGAGFLVDEAAWSKYNELVASGRQVTTAKTMTDSEIWGRAIELLEDIDNRGSELSQYARDTVQTQVLEEAVVIRYVEDENYKCSAMRVLKVGDALGDLPGQYRLHDNVETLTNGRLGPLGGVFTGQDFAIVSDARVCVSKSFVLGQ